MVYMLFYVRPLVPFANGCVKCVRCETATKLECVLKGYIQLTPSNTR